MTPDISTWTDEEIKRSARALETIVPWAFKGEDDLFTEPWRAMQWRTFVATIAPLEQRFERQAMRAFIAAGERAVRILRDGSDQEAILADTHATLIGLFTAIARDELPKILERGWKRGTNQINAQLGLRRRRSVIDYEQRISNPFNLGWPEVVNYLTLRPRQYSPQVAATTITGFRKVLSRMFLEGRGIEPMAREIQGHFTEISRYRARTIARTEVVSGSNAANLYSYQASSVVEAKTWLATRDTRTRDTHMDSDGQEVSVNEPFIVGGFRLMAPGDTSLGAGLEEIVNCRCALAPVVRRGILPGVV